MSDNAKQFDDDKMRLLKIATDLFFQNATSGLEIAITKHPSGFTFNITNLQLKTNFSSEIYLVGQRECGQRFETDPKFDKLYAWLCTNFAAICGRSGLIGGWWDKGFFFLDVVAVIPGRKSAILAGRANGEMAIYHPYSNRSIKVPPLSNRFFND